MKTIKLEVELKYNDKLMHRGEVEKKWFYNHILKSKKRNDLILHSNEIGDEVGTIKVIKIY